MYKGDNIDTENKEDFGQAQNHYEIALDFYKTNEIYLYDEALMYSYLAYT